MPHTETGLATEISEQVEKWNAARPRPIRTSSHGLLDYSLSSTLLFAPNAFGFPTGGTASAVPRVMGGSALIYSALTRYELGLRPAISMKTHLILDAISGAMLAASPWLFGFGKLSRKRSWMPHVAFAMVEMAIVALSDDRSKR
jgi:hypothetical protein